MGGAAGRPKHGPVLLEFEPGPGILTRTLLNAGTRVIALESDMTFLPALQSLENNLDGQLEVVYCSFFKLDPGHCGPFIPPAMDSVELFKKLGISAVPWTAEVPVKIFGIISRRNERNLLWKLVYGLYEGISIYHCGRVELNMLMSEKEYKVLTAKPGEQMKYQALSVLWQTACEIQLLHMEPQSSFLTNSKTRRLPRPGSQITNDNLCLVRMTPRRNLFTGAMTDTTSGTFIMMVKHCLIKQKSKVIDIINTWNLGNGHKVLEQLEIPENSLTGDLYPEEYRGIFEVLEQSPEFDRSWLYNDTFKMTVNRSLIF
ncbi:PREDICTED: dimethyladenosine transferase 2, mitochondrial isoform X1 [Gavialis gangeticus]|uniref:dimethyladenosine transferase 2, mitochondrial isoform X1 n=2 Tax=Gavialis gangeticus TaxID=94835 RepID=UPI00092E3E2D|nr:PREDICTED: dimethyladenosine transferase 2, mitochondrial isoform X1 [Gavialis gangeticus]